MTPSISFYTSCDVTKHQPSFPFWTLDAYSRVKSVHLERRPSSSLCSSRAFRTRPLCVDMLGYMCVCGKTVDIKRAYRTWNPGGFPRDEKLMARQVPERYYYFGWWLVTLSPRFEHLPPIYHWELVEEETPHRLKLEANILNAYHGYWKGIIKIEMCFRRINGTIQKNNCINVIRQGFCVRYAERNAATK